MQASNNNSIQGEWFTFKNGCLVIEGINQNAEAKLIAPAKGGLITRISASHAVKRECPKSEYLRLKADNGNLIAIKAEDLVPYFAEMDRKTLSDTHKLKLTNAVEILKAHKNGSLEGKLQQVLEMQSHFQHIRAKYQTENRANKTGEVKSYLTGPDNFALSERRLQKIIEKAFETFEKSGTEEAQVEFGNSEAQQSQFYVTKKDGVLHISTAFDRVAEGGFSVVLKSYNISEAEACMIKRVKFKAEVKSQSIAETALTQLKNDYEILQKVGGEFGIVPKPLGAITLHPQGLFAQEKWEYLNKMVHSSEKGQASDFNGVMMGKLYQNAAVYMSNCYEQQPVDRILANLYRMYKAVQVLHRKGIWHGKLKPESFLLDEQKRVYLANFGIATEKFFMEGGSLDYVCMHDQTVINAIKQQIEALLQKRESTFENVKKQCTQVRESSDLFALGLMTHLMLTGHFPYKKGEGCGYLDTVVEFDSFQLEQSQVLRKMSDESREKLILSVSQLVSRDYRDRNLDEALKALEMIIRKDFPKIREELEISSQE